MTFTLFLLHHLLMTVLKITEWNPVSEMITVKESTLLDFFKTDLYIYSQYSILNFLFGLSPMDLSANTATMKTDGFETLPSMLAKIYFTI